MDITDIVSDDYVDCTPETPVSALLGTFEDTSVTGVVVIGDRFEGVVTRRQLATSHRQPSEKVGSLVWHVPRLTPDEDVRKVARLMIDSDSQLLPVFDEGGDLTGVVTADGILEAVQSSLDAATVAQAATTDLITVGPDTRVGKALNRFREHRITHLPVVAEDSPVGIVSLYDVTGLTVRTMDRSQGGAGSGTDSFGGSISTAAGRSRGGGFGAREGELTRILDLPVRQIMVSPVRTIGPEATLETAVEEMAAIGGSSLVVTANGSPYGIVTKTDVLDALTWEAEGTRAVQVYGTDLLDDVEYDEIVAMIDAFDERDRQMTVLDAKVHLHEHDETLRGTPLVLARVRLYTDRGLFMASGEGYGASHALNQARDTLDRQIRDKKTYRRTKKPRDEAFWERRFGWLLREEE